MKVNLFLDTQWYSIIKIIYNEVKIVFNTVENIYYNKHTYYNIKQQKISKNMFKHVKTKNIHKTQINLKNAKTNKKIIIKNP